MFLFDSLNNPILIRLLIAVVILVVTLIARRFLSKWIIQALSHIKFHKTCLDPSAYNVLQKPISYFIFVTGVAFALASSPFVMFSNKQILHIGEVDITLSIIPNKIVSTLYIALVIGLVTWIVYELERIYEQFFMELNEELSLIDNTVFIRYLARILNFITLTIGIGVMLIILVPELSSLATGVGIGGAVLALVAKDSLTSSISGMFLLLDKPFVIGDLVNVNGIDGTIEDISFRSTRIRTLSQGLVIMPNSEINNASITNLSRMEKRRVDFELGVSYDTTTSQMTHLTAQIKSMLKSFDEVEKDTILVHFNNFGDYSLNIRIIYYTYSTPFADYLAIQEQVNLKIIEVCEANHIDIAFPTQTILLPSKTTLEK